MFFFLSLTPKQWHATEVFGSPLTAQPPHVGRAHHTLHLPDDMMIDGQLWFSSKIDKIWNKIYGTFIPKYISIGKLTPVKPKTATKTWKKNITPFPQNCSCGQPNRNLFQNQYTILESHIGHNFQSEGIGFKFRPHKWIFQLEKIFTEINIRSHCDTHLNGFT